MSVSFGSIIDNMATYYEAKTDHEEDERNDPLLDSGEETQSMDVVRSGMSLRTPECGDFWDDFISLSGNSEALSELLEVPRDKVATWSAKIRATIERVKKADDQESSDEKSNSISTGNEPMGDANGVDATQPPPDMRPTP
jgi:hypothetical protein